MSSSRRFLWLITLLAHLAWLGGCSTQFRVTVPGADPPAVWTEGDLQLRPGAGIRVRLHSGELFTGKLLALSEQQLMIDVFTDHGYRERTISIAEIQWITIRKPEPVLTAITVTLLVVWVCGIALIIGSSGSGN